MADDQQLTFNSDQSVAKRMVYAAMREFVRGRDSAETQRLWQYGQEQLEPMLTNNEILSFRIDLENRGVELKTRRPSGDPADPFLFSTFWAMPVFEGWELREQAAVTERVLPSKAWSVTLLQLNRPTEESGFIYPSDVLQKALTQLSPERTLWGVMGVPDSLRRGMVDLDSVCCKLTNLRIHQAELLADVEPLNTPYGQVLQKLRTEKVTVGFRPAMFCTFDATIPKIVDSCNIFAVTVRGGD